MNDDLVRPNGYVFTGGGAIAGLNDLGSQVRVGSGRPRSEIVSAGTQHSASA